MVASDYNVHLYAADLDKSVKHHKRPPSDVSNVTFVKIFREHLRLDWDTFL